MEADPEVLRLAAFTRDPSGGNPAGVVLASRLPDAAAMQRIAADVGYSETAFVAPLPGGHRYRVRYFSPRAEVPFCGHATIAAAVALAERDGAGDLVFAINDGEVPVRTAVDDDGRARATLTSLPPRTAAVGDADLAEALACFGWGPADLDASLPPAVGYAGAHHLILAVASRATLAAMDYDFGRLQALMVARDWTTVQVVWRAAADRYHARNPFPAGGVVEDPATGAAAAAFGGYLLARGMLSAPARFTILQGQEMGRPSRLDVAVTGPGEGVRVTGHAVPIEG